VIVPELPLGRPRPSEGLRELVRRYLDRRRIVTTRIEVVGPRYIALRVRARVQSCPGVDSERLADAIIQALNRFFDPLHGGPEKLGWPLGRDVYRSEVLEVIDKVEGVDYVIELALESDEGELRCGNLCLGPTSLVTLGQHQIDVI